MNKPQILLCCLLVAGSFSLFAGYPESILSAQKDKESKNWVSAANNYLQAAKQTTKSDQESNAYYDAAECFMQVPNYAEARNTYSKSLALVDLPVDNMIKTYNAIANTYIKEGKMVEAVAEMVKINAIPGITQDQLCRNYAGVARLARSNKIMQDYVGAIETFLATPPENKNNDFRNARWEVINYYFDAGDYKKAMEQLQAHLNDNIPNDRLRDVYLKLRDIYLRNNDLANAEKVMDELATLQETDWRRNNFTINDVASFYFMRGYFDKIAPLADRMIIPEIEGADKKPAPVATKFGKIRKAKASQDNVPLARVSDLINVLRMQGDLYMLAEKYPEAIAAFSEAAELADNGNLKRDLMKAILECGFDAEDMKTCDPEYDRLLAEDKLLNAGHHFELLKYRNSLNERIASMAYVKGYEALAGRSDADDNMKRDVYSMISDIYRNNGEYKLWAVYAKKAFDLFSGNDMNRYRNLASAYLESSILTGKMDQALKEAPAILAKLNQSRQKWDLANGMRNRISERYRNRPRSLPTAFFEPLKMLNEKDLDGGQASEYIRNRAEYNQLVGNTEAAIADWKAVLSSKSSNDWNKRNAKTQLEKLGVNIDGK